MSFLRSRFACGKGVASAHHAWDVPPPGTPTQRRAAYTCLGTFASQDPRRKILAGAAVLDEAEGKEEYKAALFKLLGKFLTRPEDRALFGQPSPYSKTLRRPLILMGLRRIGFPRRIVALVGGVPCPSPTDNFTEDGRHQYLHSLDIQRLPSESRRMPHRHP